jgi:copper chaperone CopZ
MITPAKMDLTFHVPSIMCKNCTEPIENALAKIEGIDSISSSVADKTFRIRYDLSQLIRQDRASTIKTNIAAKTVTLSLDALLDTLDDEIKQIGQMPAQLTVANVVSDAKASNISRSAPTLTPKTDMPSDVQSTKSTAAKEVKDKKKPLFVDVLMQHPAMKGLQAATMVLMIPMIPIMISAIYVVMSRTLSAPEPMPHSPRAVSQ